MDTNNLTTAQYNQGGNADENDEHVDKVGSAGYNQIYDQNVKSTAVVKYSAVGSPARFCKLLSNTDLNLPPDNWLREDKFGILKGEWNSFSNLAFSSLYMANDFPDCIGEVDVVSDAENIKKLLKIPYSKSPISMMVHRVGKTLLLDDFDIQKHLLLQAKKEWEWLRKFYFEHVIHTLRHKNERSFRKNRKRDHLQNKNMLSKFLYYSVVGSNDERPCESEVRDSSNNFKRSTCNPMAASQTFEENDSVPFPEEERNVFDHDHSFQRNIVWNFEDICMLLGTDMPIFGGGTHPCVSLRLRDITKPINILCGLDYWLDNLMCNVPEVLMCYHLEGIVQKYERIKTEDIPKLDNSKFSPNVVKYIAQNILSFLKSNATKAGHTYWLIKAKDDDVVKLYDLTTLCAEGLDDKEQNPYTIPVGMLQYRVARNMISQHEVKSQQGKICMLLKNCLSLLDFRKHPQVVTSAHYLLSDVYVPSTLDLSAPLINNEKVDDLNCENDDESEAVQSYESETDAISSCSVEVKALCIPDRMTGIDRITTICPPTSGIVENRCQIALKHTEEGLSCIELSCSEHNENVNKVENSSIIDYQQKATPQKPIPLPYKPCDLHTDASGVKSDKTSAKEMPITCKETPWHLPGSWQNTYTSLLLQKACISSYTMAYWLCNTHECGTALRYLELAFLTYDAVEQFSSKIEGDGNQDLHVLPCYLLDLAGDVNFLIVQNYGQLDSFKEQYSNFNAWEGIRNCAAAVLNRDSVYQWAIKIHSKMEDALVNSHRCYALAMKKSGCKETKLKIQKRLGNIKNELGVFYMSQASNLYNETGEITDSIERLWKQSSDHLKSGAKIFEEIKDDANIALLCSNIARLFRFQACCHDNVSKGGKEFSIKEKQLYKKAINYYQIALRSIEDVDNLSNIRKSISWDLCTTYFTMATLMQDYPSISECGLDKAEKDITELMLKSLKLCDAETENGKQPIYQYRAAVVHKRLGSLHHHSYRCAEEPKKKYKRNLAEVYLSKAAELFKSLEDTSEYFKVQLERIGLWKSHLSSLCGNVAKEKCLKMLLEIILDGIPMMSLQCEMQNEEKCIGENCSGGESTNTTCENNLEDKETSMNHLKLLQQQLHFVLLNFVKVHSKTSSALRNENHKFETFKKMYGEALQQPPSGLPYAPPYFLDILTKVKLLYDTVRL